MLPRPDVLRQNLRDQLDDLPDEGIVVLHNLALELQLRSAWTTFSEGVTADWAAGKYERLEEALKEAREALRCTEST
jgi:hypothetical protein